MDDLPQQLRTTWPIITSGPVTLRQRMLIHDAAELLEQRDRLIAAAKALYLAGRWSCNQIVDEEKLWKDLRDATGIPVGTETRRHLAATSFMESE